MWLKVKAFQILQAALRPNEMLAIYVMTKEKELPECVTKVDLANIIEVLCQRLGWIEENHGHSEPAIAETLSVEKEDRIQSDNNIGSIEDNDFTLLEKEIYQIAASTPLRQLRYIL